MVLEPVFESGWELSTCSKTSTVRLNRAPSRNRENLEPSQAKFEPCFFLLEEALDFPLEAFLLLVLVLEEAFLAGPGLFFPEAGPLELGLELFFCAI